jgi:hypothetical protein
MVTAYDYPAIYERIGMTGPGKLGCIMLELEPIPVHRMLGGDMFAPRYFWPSDDPQGRMSYAKGPVANNGAHATLLYGLTPNESAGVSQRESVDELLDGLDLSSVAVQDVGYFPGQFGLPYACVIAHVSSPDLIEANRRLRFLPHVDTFLDYRPHVSLAYVHADDRDSAVATLSDSLVGLTLAARGVNYGGPIQ